MTEANTLTCRKSDLVQQLLWLDSKPYSLEGREPMQALYDLEETAMVLMMGRQYGKTTFIASDALMNCVSYPFFKMLYVTPRQDQTSEFSNSKLQPFIKHSPQFKEIMVGDDAVQNVWKKVFNNGSEITLKYAYHTADAIRGISSDHVFIDEMQDIISGNVPIIEECLSGSKKQWRTYAGTPKTINNTLAIRWAQSTQNEWVLKCRGCNKWNIIGMESIGPKGLICKKCGKDLPRDGSGQWVAKKKIGPGVYLAGFRIPQVLSPITKWERVIEKLNTYSTAKFLNEVLAIPHDNSANPLTEEDLRKVCVLGRNEFKRTERTEGIHMFLGVDWGHGDVSIRAKRGEAPTGFTVMTLGGYDWDSKFQLLGMKKFVGTESDPMRQVEEVIRIARMLNVSMIGTDFGGGFMQNAQLKQLFGPDRVIEWQANESLRVNAKWIPEAGRMLFNRTECMTDRFVEIKNGGVKFFRWDDMKDFASDFLTICVDFRDDGRSMFYSHILPDDAFHSYMYCKQTADHMLFSER